tara:strand:+ start:1136 stop:1597 length:462 start_codon:yes stop_codon:yes gene_type:complete
MTNTKEYHRKYRKLNREKVRFWQKRWSDKNRKKRRLSSKKFNTSPKGIYQALKRGCLYKKIPFNWELDDFLKWYLEQPRKCFYCGVGESKVLKKNMGWSRRNNRLSFDKVIPSLGYCKNNVVLSCYRCNLIKSDFFTKDEMQQIAKKFIIPKL